MLHSLIMERFTPAAVRPCTHAGRTHPASARALHDGGWNSVLAGPFPVEERGDQAYVRIGQLAGTVLGTGLGQPGPDPDGVAVDAYGLAGGGGAAFAVQEKFQELDGLGEGTGDLKAG
ncbi:hypothetical protein [Streptomyces sp. NPDC058335]|uniref:hypothetical protein n=1 Tax=Streptomyces sp. NPDC058335 TaxID=3346451 RepID=UPI003669CDD2